MSFQLRFVLGAVLSTVVAALCYPAPVIDTTTLLHTTADAFASYTIDTTRNRLFYNVDFKDTRLLYLTAQVGGGVTRVGGSGGDLIMFATADGNTVYPKTLPPHEEC